MANKYCLLKVLNFSDIRSCEGERGLFLGESICQKEWEALLVRVTVLTFITFTPLPLSPESLS